MKATTDSNRTELEEESTVIESKCTRLWGHKRELKDQSLEIFLTRDDFILRKERFLEKFFKSLWIGLVVLPDPFRGMGAWSRPNSWTTPQGLDQRSKIKVVSKMALQRGSDAGQSRR